MDWARSETKGGQLAATNMNWAVTMGDPVANSGQAPAAGRSGLFSGLLGEEPGPWDIIPVLVATRVRLATVAARSS